MENLMPQSPRDLLTLMASTSTQIDVFSDGVIQSVKEGDINPLTVLIQLKAMEKATERILKEIKANLLTEADKYPGNDFEYLGNKITKAEHGTKYDFAKCGDPDLKVFEAEKEKADKNLKDRQDFLKSLKEPIEILRDGGEVVTLTPPTKKSASGLNVSIR
jgi:Skp family chaperone for outer membrane proteins